MCKIYIYIYIYVIMKTMCPPCYHYNGFVATATHALGHMMYGYCVPECMSCHKAIVVISQLGGHIVFMITYILHIMLLILVP